MKIKMKILPDNIHRVAEGGKRLNSNVINNNLENLISIVMVVYNGAEFIEEAIQSVIEQSLENIEFVIIDGKSNDGTLDIIKKYDDNIDYWVSEPDSGQSDAFNKGFSVCSGVLATWLNSDEVLVPGCIKKVVEEIKTDPNILWLTGDLIMVDYQKRIIKCRAGEGGSNFLTQFGFLYVYGSSSFFSLDLFNAVGGMNEELHYTMDTDLWWRFCKHGAKLRRLGEYVYIYRLHENSKTGGHIIKNEKRKSRHIVENEILCKKYMKCDQKLTRITGKVVTNIFRLYSLNYLKSIFHSLKYQNEHVDILLNALKKH